MIYVLYLTLNSQKSLWTCAIMHSWRKRETHPKILGVVASCLTVMLNVLCSWKNNKNEGMSWRPENTWSYLTRKAHLTSKVLWNCEPNYQHKLEQVETKIKKFCRHDQTVVFFFFFLQNKNRLHYAPVVQFPFGQPSHKSFCRNTWLRRGSWLRLPPISSGWVVVRFWTKMIGRLEGTSLE